MNRVKTSCSSNFCTGISTSRRTACCWNLRPPNRAARMAAMDGATRNAGELIKKLTTYYNKTRQAVITKELMDIVGGAEALK